MSCIRIYNTNTVLNRVQGSPGFVKLHIVHNVAQNKQHLARAASDADPPVEHILEPVAPHYEANFCNEKRGKKKSFIHLYLSSFLIFLSKNLCDP